MIMPPLTLAGPGKGTISAGGGMSPPASEEKPPAAKPATALAVADEEDALPPDGLTPGQPDSS